MFAQATAQKNKTTKFTDLLPLRATKTSELEAMLAALGKSQAIIEFDINGTVLNANENFLATMGYGLEEIQGQHHRLFVDAAYAKSPEYLQFWDSLRRGQYQQAEYKRLGKGGKEVWIQASYNPIFNKHGQPIKVVKIATETTASMQNRIKLAAAEAAVANASTAIMTVDRDFNVTSVNEATCQLMLKNADAFRTLWPSFNPEKLVGFCVDIFPKTPGQQRTLFSDTTRLPYRTDLSVGNLKFALLVSGIYDADGAYIGNNLEWNDVTEMRKNESMLAALDRSQATIEFGLDGRILGANANFLAAVGYTLDEIVGQHHSMFVDPAYRQTAEYQQFWQKLGRGEFDAGEYKRFGKGGTEIWIQASYNPICDLQGRPFGVVKFATDITAQVQRRLENEQLSLAINSRLQQIGGKVTEASAQAGEASAASNETAATVQMVAAAAEELSSSVREIAVSITNSKNAVDTAFEQTNAADQNTQTLNETAQSMGGIVETIQEITAQINLLALNATIESARAGEAGKGFAVVANEVKSLAAQVKAASQSIARDIDNMQTVTGAVVESLGNIKQSMDTVSGSVAGVASAIEEQNAVTTEISRNMQTAATAVGNVNNGIQTIVTAIEIVDEATRQVQQDMKTLVR